MRLVDRILELDPTGGRYSMGRAVGEADSVVGMLQGVVVATRDQRSELEGEGRRRFEDLTERLELKVVPDRQHEGPVGGAHRLVGHDRRMRIAPSLRLFSRHER